MAKLVVKRVTRNLGRRLREARREVGLSTRSVANAMPPQISVSHATIASYENGTTAPPIEVLATLAVLYRRPLNWFLEDRESLGAFRYRNLRSRVPLSEQRQFEAVAGKWADAYFRLSKHLNNRNVKVPSPERDDFDPALLATFVRQECLNLDDAQPIENTVDVLESLSAWVLELQASFGVDGAAARHGDKFVVVLNPAVSGDRTRLNVANEIAHLLYDAAKDRNGWSDAFVERLGYEFASAFLMPASQLRAAFDGKSFLKLVQFKERFGIPLAAMIYMAEKGRVIPTTTSRRLWKEMAHRGWRENEPGQVRRDRAISFETALDSAIQTKSLTWQDAERITGVRELELRNRIDGALQCDFGSVEGDAMDPQILEFKEADSKEERTTEAS